MIPDLKRTKTEDLDLQRFQDAVAETVRPMRLKKILDGVLISDVSLISGVGTNVPHGLGRNPQGWIVVGRDADANVWEDTTFAYPSSFLCLNSSADVTISLWVF